MSTSLLLASWVGRFVYICCRVLRFALSIDCLTSASRASIHVTTGTCSFILNLHVGYFSLCILIGQNPETCWPSFNKCSLAPSSPHLHSWAVIVVTVRCSVRVVQYVSCNVMWCDVMELQCNIYCLVTFVPFLSAYAKRCLFTAVELLYGHMQYYFHTHAWW